MAYVTHIDISSAPVNDFGDVFQRPGLEAVQHHLLPLEVLVDRERRRLLITRGPIAETQVTRKTSEKALSDVAQSTSTSTNRIQGTLHS